MGWGANDDDYIWSWIVFKVMDVRTIWCLYYGRWELGFGDMGVYCPLFGGEILFLWPLFSWVDASCLSGYSLMFLLLDWTISYEMILQGLIFHLVKKFQLWTLPTMDW